MDHLIYTIITFLVSFLAGFAISAMFIVGGDN
mgnify:CR=1 FL=1